MVQRASFRVSVSNEDRLTFAALSGDYNPLHVDIQHAARTEFKQCVMHGAYSAGLLSRMAGMHLPGTECLLHGMRLRFVKPIIPPAELEVEGVVRRDDGANGEVAVSVRDARSGQLLVEGVYQFGRHNLLADQSETVPINVHSNNAGRKVLVTGASGGLGAATLAALGNRGIGLARRKVPGLTTIENLEMIESLNVDGSLEGIVHCAWPTPNSDALLDMSKSMTQIEQHLAKPLRECIALARLLRAQGGAGALLVLVGSSYALPGRHAWDMPVYSLAKSLIPTLVKILSLELGPTGHRVVGVFFDVISGGMNDGMSNALRQFHADRTPSGSLPAMADCASQITWILNNPGILASGGMIDLTGGAVP